MSQRRRRAVGFAFAAALCAVLAAALAGSYRSQVTAELGGLRAVAVAARPLQPGRPLAPSALGRSTEQREVPERFVPPDAIADPAELAGLAPAAPIPAGSYLVRSQFAAPRPAGGRPRSARVEGEAVEIVVSGAAPLAAGRLPRPVDVVVTTEPGPGGGAGRTYVAAERVRLLALNPLTEGAGSPLATGEEFTATIDLDRRQALRVIQAESFARAVRLIAR